MGIKKFCLGDQEINPPQGLFLRFINGVAKITEPGRDLIGFVQQLQIFIIVFFLITEC